jgi:hypothetical protein
MKLGAALEHLRRSVDDLAEDIRAAGERHASQQDVYHMSHTLSARIEQLATSLDPFLEAYGQGSGDREAGDAFRAFAEKVRRATSSMTETIVRQGAMAARDEALMNAATVGLEETGRVLRWLKTRIKEASPQILMSAD